MDTCQSVHLYKCSYFTDSQLTANTVNTGLLKNFLLYSITGMALMYVSEYILGIGLITGTINCEFCDLGQNRNI